MFEVEEIKKKTENLWKKYWDLVEQVDGNDFEEIMKKCENVREVEEYEFDIETEFEGSHELFLRFPPETLEKAIGEIIDFYHRG